MTSATGSLGTSVPTTQSAATTDSTQSPTLNTVYSNGLSGPQKWVALAKKYATKYAWVILAAVVIGLFWYMRSGGRDALCSNFGIACDTRPLPGGVREI